MRHPVGSWGRILGPAPETYKNAREAREKIGFFTKWRLLGVRFRMPLAVKSLKSSPENQSSTAKYILKRPHKSLPTLMSLFQNVFS